MNVIVMSDPEGVGTCAADIVQAELIADPHLVLGLATGSSPDVLYSCLAARVRGGEVDMSRVSAFALDEYLGLPRSDARSYAATIGVIAHQLGIESTNVRVPDGQADDPVSAARDYEAEMARLGGIGVQILGIGANGHIGFNEPGSSFASRTRTTVLSQSTRTANARFFESIDAVPTQAVTQGVQTILESRRLILLAQGAKKAAAIRAAVEGPISASCPASALQLHGSATVIVDEEAASELTLREYFDSVLEIQGPAVSAT